MSLLSRLFGTATRATGTYTCACGAPMENTIAHSKDQYRKEVWECTEEECLQAAQAYLFDDPSESYGKGPLRGQVTGETR